MIDSIVNFHFLRPVLLGLLPIIVGVWWWAQRQSDPLRGWREQIDPDLLQALVVGQASGNKWRRVWILAGWLAATVAVAGPTWRLEPSPFAGDSPPLMILLKADTSMELSPPAPSRKEWAHLKLSDLSRARGGQPLGLIAYAGTAHLVLPPTHDTEIVAKMAAEIEPDVMPVAGDRLDLAIEKAIQILEQGRAGGSLLVIADSIGGDVDLIRKSIEGHRVSPIQILAIANEDAPEMAQVRQVARSIRGTVEPLTADDQDIRHIVSAARRGATGETAGESDRWQEAGYWLVPVIALLVVFSFRRQKSVSSQEAS